MYSGTLESSITIVTESLGNCCVVAGCELDDAEHKNFGGAEDLESGQD